MPINRKHAVKNSFLSLRALFIGGFRFLFIALNFYVNDILHQNNANEKKISRSFKSRFFNTIPLGDRAWKDAGISLIVSVKIISLYYRNGCYRNVCYDNNINKCVLTC